MKNTDTIFGILGGIARPGMDKVLEYLQTSNYFTTRCNGHHKETGGLAQHSLEVYNHMMTNNPTGQSADSIAISALLHDLGKTVRRNSDGYHGMHDQRSLQILDRLGFELTAEERLAITNHQHGEAWSKNILTQMVRKGDCTSTGAWKRAHPDQCNHHHHRHNG